MSVGQAVRRVLGPAFPVAGSAYRRIFLDVRAVARTFPELPSGATLLDVGGGDGEILNHILDRQPDIRVACVDLAPEIGGAIRSDLRGRVDLHPGTSVRQFIDSSGAPVDAAFLCDVLHHVPVPDRPALLRDTLDAFGDGPPMLIVKEIVPHGVRSAAAFWADRTISGDRGVRAIGPAELLDLARSVDPTLVARATPLLDSDYPNYCLILTRRQGG